ncbi:hypothetical protein ACFQ1S_26730 [Kibdelosporangium lantanae]|uniref:Uncharacterized protein n=1 Tax=Kibdelosporangium lantanae TaxID=1497396 RepID=A0ABW3MGV7_9PSEU
MRVLMLSWEYPPVVVGGIVPPEDEKVLLSKGVARVFTPKDYELTEIMDGIVSLVRETHGLADVRDS